jgi:hypothetical protein
MRLATIVCLSAITLLPQSASAATIGAFEWLYDAAFATGSTFNVTNEYDRPYLSVFVDLFAPGAIQPFHTLSLDDVPANGGFIQSIDDLSIFLVPDDIGSATLRLTAGGVPVTATLSATDLLGDPADFLAGSIDITSRELPPGPETPIPEPGTLILVGSALGVSGWRRLRTHLRWR